MLPFPIVVATGVGERFTLSGTDGTPNALTDASTSGTVTATWQFETDGEVWTFRDVGSDNQFQDGVEFSSKQPNSGKDLWIKATQTGVTTPGDAPNVGDSTDSWLKVRGTSSANRSWGWTQTGLGITEGTVKVDLSTDSGGSTIVATGYYKGTAEITT